MLSVHPDGSCYASALIVDEGDDRCGLCFGDGGVPVMPEHPYQHHAHVDLPTTGESYDLITDRYAIVHQSWDWWKQPMEGAVEALRAAGVRVLGMRRVRATPSSKED